MRKQVCGIRRTGPERRGGLRLFALSSAVLLSLVAGSLPADEIVLSSGRRLEGVEIIQARWDSVQYRIRGRATSVDGDDVLEIRRESRLLEPVRRAVASGNAAAALAEIERLEKSPLKGWERLELAYLKGKALILAGQLREGAAALKSYIEEAKKEKDWWLPQAVYDLAAAALDAGQPRTAESGFRELESFGGKWALKAKLGQGRALLQAGRAVEARQLFGEVFQRARSPVLRQEAAVGRAEAMIAQKLYDQAIRDLEENFFSKRKAEPGEALYTEARARAAFLMGEAYRGKGSREDLQEAEIWYLKTVALFRHYRKLYRQAAERLKDLYAQLGMKERSEEWARRLAAAGSQP